MTRKDYVLIAAALRRNRPLASWNPNKATQWNLDCAELADALKSDNGGFKRDVFLAACGYPVLEESSRAA